MVNKLKKILVSCGTGIIASSFIAEEIKKLLEDNSLDAEIIECKAADIFKLYKNADIIVSTKKLPAGISLPRISGIPFITGSKIDEAREQLIKFLKG